MAFLDLDDTITAVSTPPGAAARAIVRLSGPQTIACLQRCCIAEDGRPLADYTVPSVIAAAVTLSDDAGPLPAEVYLWPDERSYTRQPSAEIHTFGSPPLVEMALRAVCAAGARVAEPGEFTLRAFLAGRLDLTQAEAVLGVIDAVDQRQLDVALGQLAGGLTQPLARLRDELLELLAHLEAGLDFVDEDIEFISADQLLSQIGAAAETIAQIANQMTTRGETGGAPRVVLRGWPNVGKSSLFNALTDHGAAMVSDQSGTTRDYMMTPLRIGDVTCHLIDTAGIQPLTDAKSLDAAAQEMTRQQQAEADIEVFCLDASRPLNTWERETLCDGLDQELIAVLTKCDRPTLAELPLRAIRTSTVTGEGLDDLRLAIGESIVSRDIDAQWVGGTAVRCRDNLRRCGESLGRATELVRDRRGEELISAEIRIALDELGKVVGAVYTDDVLGRIFSRFCIGK